MRKFYGLPWLLSLFIPVLLNAQEGVSLDAPQVTTPSMVESGLEDHSVPIPRVDSIGSDWRTEFASEDAKRNFRRLREYRAQKEAEILATRDQLRRLQPRREQLKAERDSRVRVARDLTRALRNVTADTGSVLVGSLSPDFDDRIGYFTPGTIPVEVLRSLQRELAEEDSIAKAELSEVERSSQRLSANLDILEKDFRTAEQAIDFALAPEYRSQSFRTWVSLFFSLLIAIMIVSFFATIYKKSGNDIGQLLLSDAGLQFVTIFVLIIAIILFGILNILEGRELAAILSGIAGYILGRGAKMRDGSAQGDNPPPNAPTTTPDVTAPAAVVSVPKLFPEPQATAGSTVSMVTQSPSQSVEGQGSADSSKSADPSKPAL